METYWPRRLHQPVNQTNSTAAVAAAAVVAAVADTTLTASTVATSVDPTDEDDFDKVRKHRQEDKRAKEGWKHELQRYIDAPDTEDVAKTMDTLVWWRVSIICISKCNLLTYHTQDNSRMFPTLARIALDILPIPASSVACERLFSRAKQVATPRRTRLDPEIFEAIEALHYHWKRDLVDHARMNSENVEIIEDELADFVVMAEEEELLAEMEALYLQQ